MSDANIVQPEEVDFFVQRVRSFDVKDIGSKSWLDSHEILLKLQQQAHLEASTCREELIKELLIVNAKLEILVHEAYCVLVWRLHILPKLLALDADPKATFLIYTVLFHEATAVSLLEIVLFHPNGCEALGEASIDLIDYCVQAVTQLIGLVTIGHFRDELKIQSENATRDDLERQQRDLQYKIGIRCISILSFLTDKIDLLPLSAASRLVKTHDTPCLLSELIHCQPWIRRVNGIEKFISDKWVTVRGESVLTVTKSEAQTWLCFRQLLFNPNVMRNYEINEFRQRELAKCQNKLTVQVLDQLPPLAELKHFLCTLVVSGNKTNNSSMVLEVLPQIKDNLISNAKKIGYRKIVESHRAIFIDLNQDTILELAKKLNEAYNTDYLASLECNNEEKSCENLCGNCGKQAEKKCSKCEAVYYCCRECQVENWSVHKNQCGNKI
ncbi:zinc finger MYND domain-containing protein 10 homolog [Bradysia coprophila]|uniref:zinc finger MYND domain-containing protein 10 homolog n=1 Tax=Bradysia coprophila TaxID=38358 RepID=UPI00187DA652|nr:zinc finger MYND domain-containing protein 10 homolog [Bradysia coprophila]